MSNFPARLATLPIQAMWRPQTYQPGRVVCQISRGVAPCAPMVDAIAAAHGHGIDYWLIAGYPLVEAKNRAAEIALAERADLTLVEDDVLISTTIWNVLLTRLPTIVRLATTRCRDGSPNTYYRSDGSVLWSGTAAITVPYQYLSRLPRPVFEAREYARVGADDLAPQAAVTTHTGSDVHLWYQLHKYCPDAVIEVVGTHEHVLHPLTAERQDHSTPCWTRPA